MADYPISNVPRRIVYTGSAGVGPYAFSFEVLVNTDINVYKNDTLLTLTTDYTVSISPTLGTGSVTLVSAATGSDRITIIGSRAIERSSDFTTGGDFFANTLNDEMDSQTILVQQVAETAERSIKAPVTDPTSINMTLPKNTDRAGKYLSFNSSTGNPETINSVADVTAIAAIVDDVVAVSAIVADVTTVADNDANVTIVADNIADVNSVASNIASVNTVAGNDANITTVANDLNEAVSEINTVAVNITNVNAVGNNISNVNTVAGMESDITAVIADEADIGIVATNITNVNTVATNIADIDTVVTNITDIQNAEENADAAAASAALANDWATKTSGAVAGGEFSAKYHAQAAATSASNASTSASNASTSASNASTSASNAATSATNAANSYDAFDDRYLGAKSSAPSVDNDGNALLTGALYWNTVGNQLYVWTGSAWNAAAFSASGSVTSFNTRTGAITLSSTDVTDALTYTPQAYDANLTSFVGTFTLPTTDGTADQVLKTDGSGNISFGAVSAGDASVGSTNTFTASQIISVADDTNPALRITQTGTAPVLRVEDASNPDASPFIIDANGNVGIGYAPSSAAGRVHISSVTANAYSASSYQGANANLRLSAATATTTTGSTTGISFTVGPYCESYMGAVQNSSGYADFVFQGSQGPYSELARLTSDGKLGIGTANPTYKLEVYGSIDTTARVYVDSAGYASMFQLANPSNAMTIGKDRNGSAGWYGNAGQYIIACNGEFPLDIYTNNVKRMTFEGDSAGRINVIKPAYSARVSQNTGTVDLALSNNFTIAPTAPITLTFNNTFDGQTGVIVLANTSGYAISESNVYADAGFLATVSSPGVYLISYFAIGGAVRLTYSQNTQV